MHECIIYVGDLLDLTTCLDILGTYGSQLTLAHIGPTNYIDSAVQFFQPFGRILWDAVSGWWHSGSGSGAQVAVMAPPSSFALQ